MREKLANQIIVTHKMGGMMGFERTGLYPNTLRIKSSKFNHTWRLKLKEGSQSGMLKIKGLIVYHYGFDESGFSIVEVVNGIIIPASLNVVMKEVMND
jgi:hypothetical protein